MGICKFCGYDKKLVKSHILPRAFYEAIKMSKDRGSALKVVRNVKGMYPYYPSRIGVYDKNIVCLDCEKLFKNGDDYAIDVFLHKEEAHIPLTKDGRLIDVLLCVFTVASGPIYRPDIHGCQTWALYRTCQESVDYKRKRRF